MDAVTTRGERYTIHTYSTGRLAQYLPLFGPCPCAEYQLYVSTNTMCQYKAPTG